MTYRTFLALPLADAFLKELQSLLQGLRSEVEAIKWVRAEQAHVTLHFFGPTTGDQIQKISACVKNVVTEFSPLTLSLDGLGTFPPMRSPRVIWLGISGMTEELCSLQDKIEKALKAEGFPCENRLFHPHLTLGRIREGRSLPADALSRLLGLKPPRVEHRTLERIVFYQSHLKPDGPHYEVLETFLLSPKPQA